MEITLQSALLINGILYFLGFIVMSFIILRYRNRVLGLNSFAYYFLLNSIGIISVLFKESSPYLVGIILGNYIIFLASIFLAVGVIKFFDKKIPYLAFSFVSAVFILFLVYFTYIDFIEVARIHILLIGIVALHIYVLYLLFMNNRRYHFKMQLLCFIVMLYVLTQITRMSLVVFGINSISVDSIFLVIVGALGSLIAAGVLSLISNKLISNLAEGESAFSNFIEYAPIPAMVHAEDGEMLYLSRVWTEITGYTIKDIPTTDQWIEKAYRNNRKEIRTIIRNLYKNKNDINDNDVIILTKDGKERIWSFHSTYIGVLPDGRNAAMSVARDLTEEKLKEQEVAKLQEKNIKLTQANETAIKLANLLVWRMNVEDYTDDYYITINNHYKEVMGWETDEDGLLKESVFLDSIYPDEEGKRTFEQFVIENKKMIANESDEYVLSYIKHLNKKTNEAIYLEHHTQVEERYENGKIKIVSGYVVNITESKLAESALQFERNKAQMYLDIMGSILLVLDVKGNITLLNKSGCKILGVEEEEIIGKNWFDNFLPKDMVTEIKEVFARIVTDEESYPNHYENVIINSNGEELMINWYNSLVHDIDGNVSGVISSGIDISDRKRYEESLRSIGYHDALTGLYNRRYYEENLDKIDVPENYPLTIVMGDINGLKLINDAFGHASGDNLLISAANVILETCRETDLVARIGGDEFVIAMPKTNEIEAEKVINKIHEKAKLISIESIQLSISFGSKTKSHSEEDVQEIYRSAEDLMYREKLLEIPSMRSGAIETILNTLYEKDENSEIHSRVVSNLSEKIAKAYGMNRQEVAEAKTAGLLHDIGKIIIPSSIINKNGDLTHTEYLSIKNHSEIGFRILNSTQDMRSISNIILCHHERWDGDGYPRGIKGKDIPIMSRIISIADAFDAMTSERTYRTIVTKEEALKEIIANSGSQFDPKIVKIFEKYFEEITIAKL